MPQIHLHAEPGDYAPVVLLPGDPNRATRIAARFDGGLDASRLVTSHRGLLGYTGRVDGVPVSVQTTMMGAPTTSIVVEELLMLGVTTFIRVGTTGGFGRTAIGDAVVAMAAAASTGVGSVLGGGEATAPTASLDVVLALVTASRAARPHDARRTGRHERRVLRPDAGRRRPLGPPRLPVGRDGDGGPVPDRDARAGQGPAGACRLHPHRVGRHRRPGPRAARRARARRRRGSGRPRTRSRAGSTSPSVRRSRPPRRSAEADPSRLLRGAHGVRIFLMGTSGVSPMTMVGRLASVACEARRHTAPPRSVPAK